MNIHKLLGGKIIHTLMGDDGTPSMVVEVEGRQYSVVPVVDRLESPDLWIQDESGLLQ